MLQAVIFDMDGLLVDTNPVWDAARRWMASEAGKTWGPDDNQAVMGVSTGEWVDYMTERLDLKLTPSEVEDAIVDRMAQTYRERIPWLPGAVEAVELAAREYRAALASGSPPSLIEAVVADGAVAGRFEVVVSADEIGAGKPAPDVYLATAERLGLEPADCVCLEDSANGILSGVRAGMKVIAVPDQGFQPPPDVLQRADLVLGSLEEFTSQRLAALA